MRIVTALILLSLCFAAHNGSASPGPGLYTIDGDASRVRILVFRAGIAGRLGHNHVVSHRDISGCLRVAEPLQDSSFTLTLPLALLEVDRADDRQAAGSAFPGTVPQKDIEATRTNMLGSRLLDAERHPVARVMLEGISPADNGHELELAVELAGARTRLSYPVTVEDAAGSLRIRGEQRVTHEQLNLRPFSAAFGALRVADEMRFEVDLRAISADDGAASDCERALAVVDDDSVALPHDRAE